MMEPIPMCVSPFDMTTTAGEAVFDPVSLLWGKLRDAGGFEQDRVHAGLSAGRVTELRVPGHTLVSVSHLARLVDTSVDAGMEQCLGNFWHIDFYDTDADIRRRLDKLRQIYSVRDATAVVRFLRLCPSLVDVLMEAQSQLECHFGADPQVVLEVVSDPEGERDELFAYVRTSVSVGESLARLDRFDEEWFLDQLDRVNGQLNFDLEYV